MRITDLLDRRSIELNASPKSKNEAIRALGDLMAKSGKITDKDSYIKGLFAREEESTTAVGEGIAIPHYKGSAVSAPGLAAMVIKDGVDFDSIDGLPVKLIFAIAAPDVKENVHLDVLSKLSVLMMDENFTTRLINAKNADEFIEIINETETQKDEPQREEIISKSGIKIVAVTSCPTGIAHTYMAEEGLYKAAQKAGCSMKVETRGSGGAKNVLTKEEIEAADCVIIAADAKVPMERFNGKKLLSVPVSDGISKADLLIEKAISGKIPVYHAKENGEEENSADNSSVGQRIYKHLMSGVSHMLPFVIGGGILIALAFLLDNFELNPAGFGTNTPLAAFFKKIGETAFGLMLPVLAGFIAYSIADRPGLAVGFVGGMFAANGNPALEFTGNHTGFAGYLQNTVFGASGSTVSGFLGALAAGFVAGYIILLLKKLFSHLPKSMDGIKPILLYPLCGIFLIGALMLFVFNPIIGVVNNALAAFLNSMGSSSKIVLGIILGAMMAIDMGGPINKAAYVFGTASIATAASSGDPTGYMIMAAVMAGGMVPPVGIALATTFFKNRFTAAERRTSITNYIMGACFITEGAIPFAASDPLHVIPATAVGSGLAGALSMLFGCTLMAPHGGLFVFAVVGNWPMYIVAWLAGSVVTMLLLALLKKPLNK
ncbi:MAG: fructose-specific PTS transporter subunit EIIC [Clostridiales bacterium]|nr:fructose-specific PTS transporter subunit EIIC [Clostridiales bacterium]